MKTTAIADTKGGVGKTTVCANLGAFYADAGLRTLLIDLDPTQPSLSSYYPLLQEAEGGIYDMLASNVIDPARIISSTTISNLSLILSNDVNNQLNNLLLQAPDGRLRLNHLTPAFQDQFDLVLIDTQGAKSVLVEMAALASDLVVSPLEPNMLAAREFNRGTLQMLDGLRAYERLGMKISPGSGVSLAPFADAVKLIVPTGNVKILKADDIEASDEHLASQTEDEQRDILGEMEIAARLMITGCEDREDARLTRADRSAIRQCILNAAHKCVAEQRIVLPEDIRGALRDMGLEPGIPSARSARFLEMAEAMSMFCMGSEADMFNRPGTPWPEADITIVDLATYAREGCRRFPAGLER